MRALVDIPADPSGQACAVERQHGVRARAKLDAACARLEAQARAEADAARPAYEAKKAAYDAKRGRRGHPTMIPRPRGKAT